MLGGADNPNGELPSYITGANSMHFPLDMTGTSLVAVLVCLLVRPLSSGEATDIVLWKHKFATVLMVTWLTHALTA